MCKFSRKDHQEWQLMRDSGISIKEISKQKNCSVATVQECTSTPKDVITVGRLYDLLKGGDFVGNKTIVYNGKVCGKFEQSQDEQND